MIQEILSAIKTSFQAASQLSSVTNYHLVDGMIPGLKPTISISCGRIKFEDYTSDQDEAIAPVRIYVYIQDMNPERGEATIRALTEEVRFTLLGNMYLTGLVDNSSVKEITFESELTQKGELLHFALIDYEVKYYQSRHRPDNSIPLTIGMNNAVNSEVINFDY
jgi:hypothetical protein